MPWPKKYPGVYVEKLSSGVHAIAGVATGITAFVGAAGRGKTYRPLHITSFGEFERRFGGLVPNLELGYAVRQFFLNGGSEAWVVRVARTLTDAVVIKGIQALDAVDLFNLLVLPGLGRPKALAAAAGCCRQRRAFLIMDAPKVFQTPAQVEQIMQKGVLPKTSYAAVFFPWIKIVDPASGGKMRVISPGGSITGVFARSDASRGVWKASAGMTASLQGVEGLACGVSDSQNENLNSLGVNCLRTFPVNQIVVWGSRTLEGSDGTTSEWKYIPVRRLGLYIEESIYRGITWAVFEPNTESLWSALRLNITNFLNNLFRQGAFQGSTPKDAYFVKCDASTMTQADILNGVVNILVGFAPLKPAEFVVIRISQRAGQTAP